MKQKNADTEYYIPNVCSMNINNPISDHQLHTNNTGQEDDHYREE